jgi:hypothetical protein
MTCAFLPLLALAACQPAATDDSNPTQDPTCETGITSTYPMDGSSDAYYRDSIEFVLSEPDPGATVIADFEGTQSSSEDGLTVIYTPAEPLEPLTAYEVSLDYCHGTPTIGFTTSAYGQPVDDPLTLLGRTWSYDLREARFYEAVYVGALLQSFAERVGLVSVVGVEGQTVDLRLAVADDNDPPGQDFCARTVDIQGVDFADNPFLQFGPTSIEFQAYLGVIRLHEMLVQTSVAPAGNRLGGMVIEAVIDVRSVGQATDMEVGELCDLLEVYGAPCESCPGDGAPYCVSTAADRLEAAEVDTVVDPILEAYADPRCEEEAPE